MKTITDDGTIQYKEFLTAVTYSFRKDGKEHPSGRFDSKGRWYPSEKERRACCDKCSSPTRSYPYSLNKHCRTLKHVANYFGVDNLSLVRKYVKHYETFIEHPKLLDFLNSIQQDFSEADILEFIITQNSI